MAGVPFKVCVPSKNGLQLGVVASSLEHLGTVLEQKLGIAPQMRVYLGDGTLVCDEEYFQLLKPQTKLTVVEEREIFQDCSLGEKRPWIGPADSAKSLPTKQRRATLPPWQVEKTLLPANKKSVADAQDSSTLTTNLVSCLRISRVEENVSMQSPSPPEESLPLSLVCDPPGHSSSPYNICAVTSAPNSSQSTLLPCRYAYSVVSSSPNSSLNAHPVTIVPNPSHHPHLQCSQTLPAHQNIPLFQRQMYSQPQVTLQPHFQPTLLYNPTQLFPQHTFHPVQPFHHSVPQIAAQQQPQIAAPTQGIHHQQISDFLPPAPSEQPYPSPWQYQLQEPTNYNQRFWPPRQAQPGQMQPDRLYKSPINQHTNRQARSLQHKATDIPPLIQMTPGLVSYQQLRCSSKVQAQPTKESTGAVHQEYTPSRKKQGCESAPVQPLAVVDADANTGLAEESEDEEGLCIIDGCDTSCSSTPLPSLTISPAISDDAPADVIQIQPRSGAVKPSNLFVEYQHKPDLQQKDASLQPPLPNVGKDTSALLSDNRSQDRKSVSLDEGYSSSASFTSTASVSDKLPFADFDAGSNPCTPTEPHLWNDDVFESSGPESGNKETGGGTEKVDVVGDAQDLQTIDTQSKEETADGKLLVSIPVLHRNGRLLCQGYADLVQKEELVTGCLAENDELVVSIPLHLEESKITHVARGRGGRKDSRHKISEQHVMDSNSLECRSASMDVKSVGCLKACSCEKRVVAELACKTKPSHNVCATAEQPEVLVEEYARQEIVLDTPLRQLCTEVDIDRCVARIMSEALKLQLEEWGIEIEDLVDPSMANIGNEVSICSGEEGEEDKMAQVCLEFRPLEEVEIDVVDVVEDVQKSDTRGPDPILEKRLISEKISRLLDIADALSEEDSAAIKRFFTSTTLDSRKGLQRYTLKQHAKNGQSICLELNFASGKWRGIISG